MNALTAISQLLSDIKSMTYELTQALSQNKDDAQIYYVKPVNTETQNEGEEPQIVLTNKDFNPQPLEWPYCSTGCWSNKTIPNRARNSLPRFPGYVLTPEKRISEIAQLCEEINHKKDEFRSLCKTLFKTNKTPASTILIDEGIFSTDENFELTVRHILTTSHSDTLTQLNLGWLKSPSSQTFKGSYEGVIELAEKENKIALKSAIMEYERQNPNSTYVKRYYSAPSIIAKCRYIDGWKATPIYASTPIIVLNRHEDLTIKSELKAIDVTIDNGVTRYAKSIETNKTKVHRITSTDNVYALLK